MENESLINEAVVSKRKKLILTSHSCYVIQNVFLLSIFLLQIFITAYLILLGRYAQQLNLFNFNQTETDDYIAKFKIIIDHVCHDLVNCTHH